MKSLAFILCVAASALHGAEAETWWSFQPLKRVVVPQPVDSAWAWNDIDRFVLAALEAKELRPVEDADPVTMLRRIAFDLTGLPPSVGEIAALEAGAGSDARSVVRENVGRLLASPRFGERWGRHWLDIARYAESSGRDENVTFPHAWRYRDYVIAAWNADTPYDRFVQQQIAGDLLPAADAAERARNLIATGFLAIGAKSLNSTDPRQFAVDLADEQISAVGEAMLGLTLGCARCHDHMTDPLTQREYTALAGIFLSTDTRYGTAGGVQGRNMGRLVELPEGSGAPVVARAMTPVELRRKQARADDLQSQLRRILADRAPDNPNRMRATGSMSAFDVVRIFTQSAQAETELAAFDERGLPRALAMGALDRPVTEPAGGRRAGAAGPGRGRRSSGFNVIGDAPLFARGDIAKEREKVPRGMPALLGPAPVVPPHASGRLELARWITSPQNPLTSRVIVNRTWAWLFGRGLVASVDNLGASGESPSHPELLDFLAAKLIADGWSMKRLITEIVTSRTYALGSARVAANLAADPDNVLLWRHSPRRLDAEAIRDSMLAAAGVLDLRPPAGSPVALAGDGPIGGPRRQAMSERAVAQAQSNARSVYLPVARNVPPDVLTAFDFPDGVAVRGLREVTSVPTQSLFLMNSEFVASQARALAARVLSAEVGFDERFLLASRLVLGRAPIAGESEAARAFLSTAPGDEPSRWAAVARALFGSADFRTLH